MSVGPELESIQRSHLTMKKAKLINLLIDRVIMLSEDDQERS